MKRIFILIFIQIVVVFLLFVFAKKLHTTKTTKELNSNYAEIRHELVQVLKNYNPGLKLDRFDNKILILNIWEPWCTPCISEMPELNNIERAFKGRKEIEFIALSSIKPDSARQFFKEKNIKFNYTLYRSDTSVISLLYKKAGLEESPKTIPINAIIDRKGYLDYIALGYSEENAKKIKIYLNNLNAAFD
jgi:thiol-disulfide isomerase/thioredoxin